MALALCIHYHLNSRVFCGMTLPEAARAGHSGACSRVILP